MQPDFAERDGPLWLDGELVPWRRARLHVLSHSLHFAGAVFEGIRVYGGQAFALAEHMERLERSARLMGYALPYSPTGLADAAADLVERHGLREGYLRPIAWRGSQSVSVPAAGCRVRVAIAAFPWPDYYDAERRRRGLRLAVSRWRRPAPDTAPVHSKTSGLYGIATLARDEAVAGGFDDALLLDWRGLIAEATGANIFLVLEGALVTPPPVCFLDGITRRTVMALARQRGVEVRETALPPGAIGRAEAAFLTGTAVEVAAIGRIGEHELRADHPLGAQLAADYAAWVRSGPLMAGP